MTKKEFTTLDAPLKSYISVHDLVNKTPRTLVYGYDLDRNTHHVYLMDGEIHSDIYSFDGNLLNSTVGIEINPYKCSPNKRAYPARCDFEFCKLLKEHGVQVSYTTFDERQMDTVNGYYGITFSSKIKA